VLGVALAVFVHSHWSPFLGVTLCETTGLLISPVTWTHQMIWVIPAIVWTALSPDRPNWGRSAATIATVVFWIAPIWWVPNGGKAPLREGAWQLLCGNTFFLLMVVSLAACATSVLRGTRLGTHAGPDECPEPLAMPDLFVVSRDRRVPARDQS
jgi:alpha-1,2-mannosyltransferase